MIEMDPSNYSRLERGKDIPPSSSDKLNLIAHSLGIPKGSEEYGEMVRLADIGRGEIPRTILSDRELAAKLPVFFRTLEHSQADGDNTLDGIIKTIRREFE